jgi:PGF-CTERM protein
MDAADTFARDSATFWAGQDVYFNGNESETYQIREWDDGDGGANEGQVASLVTEFNTDENGNYVIDTGQETLETGQEYVITNEDQDVVQLGDFGEQVGTVANPDNDAVDPWEIQTQTLDAEWSEDDVSSEEGEETTADLELTSNRGTYDVYVSADGLDIDDLEDIFSGYADADEDDDELRFDSVSDPDIEADFEGIDADDYNFTVEVADTDADATAAIEVTEAEGEMSLPDTAVNNERGDTATITAQFSNEDEGYVQIGDDDVGYNVTLFVEDGGDGEVELEWNSYYAGRNASDVEGVDGDDIMENVSASTVFSLTEDSDDDGDDWEVVGVHSEPLSQEDDNDVVNALEAGDYDVEVGVDAMDVGDQETLDDDQDVTTVTLNERSTEGVQIWTLPEDADFDDQEELLAQVNQTSSVAESDYVVVQLQASGIYGMFEEDESDSLTQPGVELTIEEADAGPNQDADSFNIGDQAEDYFLDDENNSAYFVVPAEDAGELDFEDGDRYDAYWEINEDNPLIEGDEDTAGEEKETASATFTFKDRDATFRNIGDDEILDVQARENATIRGTTTVAPGTELTVRLRGTSNGQSYLQSLETTVTANRTFEVAANMSGKEVGSNFTVQARAGGEDLGDEVDGQVVEATETPTGTATATETPGETTTAGGTPTATATPTEGTPTPTEGTPESTPSPTPTNTPGFGIGVALVALLGAALLALRRD